MIQVFVDGAEGTTGLQLEERLRNNPQVRIIPIDTALRKDSQARKSCYDKADVVFLCLPDAAAREAMTLVTNPHTVVLDASTAHRTASGWAYGLPELSPSHRVAIETGNRIAVPGCHASGFCALVYPLIMAELLVRNLPLTCTSLTGYSGGGKAMIAAYEVDTPPRGARPYALGLQHKHLPEMTAQCGLSTPPIFLPIVTPVRQGMLVTVPVCHDARSLWEQLAAHYEHAKNITVADFGGESCLQGGQLDMEALNGTDTMEIFVFGHTTQALLVARFDNLGKGAAGAAMQCMELRMKL